MAVDTVWRSNTGIEQAQVVIDLSDSPYSWTGIFTSSFLIDGNSRAKTINWVYIRLFHIA